MPTNEERREVARKLREKYIERNTPGYFEVQDLNFQALNYLKDLESCLPDGDSAFTVLADLMHELANSELCTNVCPCFPDCQTHMDYDCYQLIASYCDKELSKILRRIDG